MKVLLAALALAALATACSGDHSKQSANGTPPVAITATMPAEPSVSVTDTPSTTAATPLTIGMQAALGYDTVLYYSVGCYACGGPSTPHFYRVYVAPDGNERTDDLFLTLAVGGGHPQSFAADWPRGELWSAWCRTGYCGIESDPSADAVEVLYHSRDGGVSWEAAGNLEPGSSLVGPMDGELLTSVWKASHYTYRLLPSGREPTRPPGPAASYANFVPGQGIVWQQADGTGGPTTFFDANGKLLFAPQSQGGAQFIEKAPQGNLVTWQENPDSRERRVGLLDDSGRILRSWSWVQPGAGTSPGPDLVTTGGWFAQDRLYGSVLTPDWFAFGTDNPGVTQEQIRHGRQFPIEIALINLDTATVHPLFGPSFRLTGNENPYAVHLDTGPFARVNTGSDCLNVREKPSTTAPALGCFRDGVLLRRFAEPSQTAEGTSWVAVETPDGRKGWATGEFMELGG